MRRAIVKVTIALSLSGCIAMDVPDDIKYSETISSFKFSCEQPYALTRGCNSWNYANIPFEIEGRNVHLAATDDGHVLVVTNNMGDEFGSVVFEGLTFHAYDRSARDMGWAIRNIVDRLGAEGVKVLDIKVISVMLDVWGYVLVTDGDALSALGVAPSGT